MPLDNLLSNGGASTNGRFVFRGSDVPKLDLDSMKGVAVTTWKKKWQSYVNLSGLRNEDETTKLDVLYQGLSTSTLHLLDTLKPNVNTLNDAVQALMTYADNKENVIVERKKLFERRQKQGESTTDFAVALQDQLKQCKFSEADQDAIKTTIFVIGLQDTHTVEAALALKNPSFEKVTELARSREVALQGRKLVQENQDGGDAQVARVTTDKKLKKTGPSNNHNNKSSPPCPWCGNKQVRHVREECPASGQTCSTCKKKGHYARVCRSGQQRQQERSPRDVTMRQLTASQNQQLSWLQQQQQMLQQQQEAIMQQQHEDNDWFEEPQVAHLYPLSVEDDQLEVNQAGSAKLQAPRVKLNCTYGGQTQAVMALPDTGADVSAAGFQFLAEIKASSKDIKPSTIKPRSANGQRMRVYGKVKVKWQMNDTEYNDEVHIIEGAHTTLLSWRAVRALGMLSSRYPKVNVIDQPPLITIEETDQDALLPSTVDEVIDRYKDDEGKQAEILKRMLLKEFTDVFSDEIKVMKGEEFTIDLKEDAVPYAIRAPRAVPLAYREKLQNELKSLQDKGIIEPVVQPTEWCSPIVVDEKPGGGVRVCVDLTMLNRYVKRAWYISDPPQVAVSTIPPTAKFFSTLDATKGYHQCPLDDASKNLTTFITPFGRFRYVRAPFGISSISEHYNRRMDEALEGINDHKRTVDDILMHDEEMKRHYYHVRELLVRCRERNITLSPSKFHFGQPRVKFAGFIVHRNGYELDDAITAAISKFPTPKSLSQLRAFCGLVNQLGTCVPDLASKMSQLRPLLSTKNTFKWDEQHQAAFEALRMDMARAPTLAFYDAKKPTRLTTDASREGLGFVLQQQSDNSEWKTVQAGSRMLTGPESRYAIIELEMLAVCFAVRKTDMYIRGTGETITVRTDHKPLVSIINQKGMHEIMNPRLRRMKEFLMPYTLIASYVPGSENGAADALSRSPIDPPLCSTVAAIRLRPQEAPERVRRLLKAAEEDETYKRLRKKIHEGFPNTKAQLEADLRPFWQVHHDLSVHEDVVFMGERVVVPQKLRKPALEALHKGHQGIQRTKNRARANIYWPGIDADVTEMVESCLKCQEHRPQQAQQPMQPHERPEHPGQYWAADIFTVHDTHYLAMIDIYSTWVEVAHLKNETTTPVIQALDMVWSRFGIPERLYSDGGPQFTSVQFKTFTQANQIKHVLSAPTYPQSNSFAEAAVKTLKKLMQKCWKEGGLDEKEFVEGLRQHRNTPSVRDGLTPAQKMLGRPICDTSDMIHRREAIKYYKPKRDVQKHDDKAKKYYDQTSRPLAPLVEGNDVMIWCPRKRKFDRVGVVLSVDDRRVTIKTQGTTIQRDRRHLIKLNHKAKACAPPSTSTPLWWTSITEHGDGAPSQRAERNSGRQRVHGQGPEGASSSQRRTQKWTDWAAHARARAAATSTPRAPMPQPQDALLIDPIRDHEAGRNASNERSDTIRQRLQTPLRPTKDPKANATVTPAQRELVRDESRAPKKTARRSELVNKARARAQNMRQNSFDERRLAAPNNPRERVIPLNLSEGQIDPRAEQSMSLQEAFKNAFDVVRKSARLKRPPVRYGFD